MLLEIDPRSIQRSWIKVCRNTGQRYPIPSEERLSELAIQLSNGRYTPRPLKYVALRKPDGSIRPLLISPFTDRVCQRALLECLFPEIEGQLVPSVAYCSHRKATPLAVRGIYGATKRVLDWKLRGRWLVVTDIESFFSSIPVERVCSIVNNFKASVLINQQVNAFLSAPVAPTEFENILSGKTSSCLRQGSPLSPVLASLYVRDIDAEFEKRAIHCIRYVDDILIAVDSEAEAVAAREFALKAFGNLGLTLSSKKTKIVRPSETVDFLGLSFTPTGKVKLPPRRWNSLQLGLNELRDLPFADRLAKVNSLSRGWWQSAKLANLTDGERHRLACMLGGCFESYVLDPGRNLALNVYEGRLTGKLTLPLGDLTSSDPCDC